MPARPPKKWMRRCVKFVEAGGSARNPRAVCGATWYHRMSGEQKAAALRAEGKTARLSGMPRTSTAIAVRRALARRHTARPIVIRTTKLVKHKKHRHMGARKYDWAIVAGGFGLGLIDKSGMSIPTLPYLGRAGTIGVIAYAADRYLHMGGKLARDVSLAAFTIAAYELGKEGEISGIVGDVDYIAGDF